MLHVLPPSGERAIVLLSGRFHSARVRLTGVYVALLALILFLSSGIIYSTFSNQLEHRFTGVPLRRDRPMVSQYLPPRPEEVRADLINALILVNGLLLFIGGIVSYWLAGVTLEPVQASYEEQRRFLSNASHELRTPLAILQTDLENELLEKDLSLASQEQIKSHLEEVERMSRMVTDLLTLSRFDERDLSRYESTTFDLYTAVQDSIERLHAIAARYQITLSLAPLKQPIEIYVNKELFLQALHNIVKNGIFYNKTGGTVNISLEAQGTRAKILVVDSGIGIAPDDLTHLFDRFYRVDKSRSRETGGSGLGLAIVQSIMTHLRGSIEIKSVVDEGTKVTLIIPRSRPS